MAYIEDGKRVKALRDGKQFKKGQTGVLIRQGGIDSENYYFVQLDGGELIGPSLEDYWKEDTTSINTEGKKSELQNFMDQQIGLRKDAKAEILANSTVKKKHRLTQGQYGDYQAASLANTDIARIWEGLKKDPGIEIVSESELDPNGLDDISVLFMYPEEIKITSPTTSSG